MPEIFVSSQLRHELAEPTILPNLFDRIQKQHLFEYYFALKQLGQDNTTVLPIDLNFHYQSRLENLSYYQYLPLLEAPYNFTISLLEGEIKAAHGIEDERSKRLLSVNGLINALHAITLMQNNNVTWTENPHWALLNSPQPSFRTFSRSDKEPGKNFIEADYRPKMKAVNITWYQHNPLFVHKTGGEFTSLTAKVIYSIKSTEPNLATIENSFYVAKVKWRYNPNTGFISPKGISTHILDELVGGSPSLLIATGSLPDCVSYMRGFMGQLGIGHLYKALGEIPH